MQSTGATLSSRWLRVFTERIWTW